MASGVAIPDEAKNVYSQDLKMNKKHRYVTYRLSDDQKEIIVEKKASKDATYEEFLEDLHEAEAKQQCRYAVYDMQYTTDAGSEKNKLVFYSWAPDSAKVKAKMVHASSKDAFKKALGEGLSKEIQASDAADLDINEVIKELKTLDRH